MGALSFHCARSNRSFVGVIALFSATSALLITSSQDLNSLPEGAVNSVPGSVVVSAFLSTTLRTV